jgi:hypothetical protein
LFFKKVFHPDDVQIFVSIFFLKFLWKVFFKIVLCFFQKLFSPELLYFLFWNLLMCRRACARVG